MLLEVMKEVETLTVSEKEAKLLSEHLPNMVKENEKDEWTLVKPDLLALQAKLQEVCLWTQSSSDTVSFQSESKVHNAGNITAEDDSKPQTDADGESPDPVENDSKPQTDGDGESLDPAKDDGSVANASKPQTDAGGESPDPAKTLQMLLNLNDANVAANKGQDEAGWSNCHGTSTDQAGQDEASWSNWHWTSTDQAGQDKASWSNWHWTSTDQGGQHEASWSNWHATSTDVKGQDEASWSNWHATSTDVKGQDEASWSNWHGTSTDVKGQDEASWSNWHATSTDVKGQDEASWSNWRGTDAGQDQAGRNWRSSADAEHGHNTDRADKSWGRRRRQNQSWDNAFWRPHTLPAP